jgi:hypothetical protein
VRSRTGELAELIKASRSVMSSFAKAKTAKIGTNWDSPEYGSPGLGVGMNVNG